MRFTRQLLLSRFLQALLMVCIGTNALYGKSNSKVDSLKARLSTEKNELERGFLNYRIADELDENDPQASLPFAQSAISIGEKLHDTDLIINANVAQGIAQYNLGDIAAAFKSQNRALELAQASGNELQMASCYTNIGRLYATQEDSSSRVKEYYRKSMVIREKYRHKLLPSSYLNMSTAFSTEENYDSARIYCEKAIAAIADSTDQRLLAYSYNTLGSIYFAQKDFTNSILYFEKSKEIKEKVGDKKGLVSAYANIGESYAGLKKYDLAIQNLNIAIAMATTLRNKVYLREVYFTLSDVYKETGDYKSAYEMFKMYTLYRDSIFDDKKSKEILALQEKYEAGQKQRENELLKANNDIQAESIVQKDRFNYVIIACLLLVLLGVVFLFRAYAQKKKANEEISQQKILLEQKNKEVFDSISYAQRLQQAILATPEEINRHVPDNFLLYQPKDIVAGDFYFFETTAQHIFSAAADCTGHGVPGAMMSIVCSNALTRCVKEFNLSDPGKILDKARELVVETFEKSGQDVKDGMDISLLVVDRKTNELKWAGANNPLWIVGKSEGLQVENTPGINFQTFQLSDYSLLEIKGDKQPIGKTEDPKPFTTQSIPIPASDVSSIYLLTDGFADQFGGPKGKKFMYKQLKELLVSISHLPMSEQQEKLAQALQQWKGNLEQVDDVCVIGIRIG